MESNDRSYPKAKPIEKKDHHHHHQSHAWFRSEDRCGVDIWAESRRDIQSYVAYLGQLDVTKPIYLYVKLRSMTSNIKAPYYECHVFLDSIDQALLHLWKRTKHRRCFIAAVAAPYISMDLRQHHFLRPLNLLNRSVAL